MKSWLSDIDPGVLSGGAVILAGAVAFLLFAA
jgi:hypothetical protein